MFTGIIRDLGVVSSSTNAGHGKKLFIEAPESFLQKLEKGITSVAVNGSCHTVTDILERAFAVYSSFETLSRTNIGELKRGESVNLELPLTPLSLLDGHLVQGHIDGCGTLISVKQKSEASLYKFGVGRDIIRYLVEKDSISIDGISLTIFNIDATSFEVAVIPETAKKTVLSQRKSGDKVNIEVNIFAKYSYQFSGKRDQSLLSLLGSH